MFDPLRFLRDTPARVIARERFGTPTRPVESTGTVGTTATKVIPNNPRRIAWQLFNRGTAEIYIALNSTINTGTGIPIPPNNWAAMEVDSDGESVGWEWWAISGAAGQAVYLLEVEGI